MKLISLMMLLVSLNSFSQTALDPNPKLWSDEEVDTILTEVKGARLIGIGESIHGSEAIGLAQLRIVRQLVENENVRILFYESTAFEAEGVSEWVRGDSLIIEKEIQNLHFASDEIFSILKFLRKWNLLNPEDPVEFVPVDIYVWPWIEHEKIKNFIKKLTTHFEPKELLEIHEKIFKNCYAHDIQLKDKTAGITEFKQLRADLKSQKIVIDEDRFQACITPLEYFIDEFSSKKEEVLSDLSEKEYSDLMVSLRSLWARQNHMKGWAIRPSDYSLLWNSRDKMMAENLMERWRLYGESKNAAFIAHTSHVSKWGEEADWWNFGYGRIKSAGQFLSDELGMDYRTIAITGYKMEGLQGDFLAPVSPDSLDLKFHNEGKSCVSVSALDPVVQSKEKWFIQNENTVEEGVNGVLINVSEHFNSLIYFDQSRVSKVVPPSKEPTP